MPQTSRVFTRGWLLVVGGCLALAGVVLLVLPSGQVGRALGSGFSALPALAGDTQGGCAEREARRQERAAILSRSDESALRIAVIGDSYSVGAGLDDVAASWPSYLPGEVRVDGFSGSGFTAGAGPCRGVAYGDRLDGVLGTAPGLLVLEGGLNDWLAPTAEIESSLSALLDRVGETPVVVIGPASAPRRLREVARVDAALATVAAAHGVAYVSATGWDLDYLPDSLHPSPSGHRVFGEAVAAVIRELGLLDATVTAGGPVTR